MQLPRAVKLPLMLPRSRRGRLVHMPLPHRRHREKIPKADAGLPGSQKPAKPKRADEALDLFAEQVARLLWRQLCQRGGEKQAGESQDNQVKKPGP